MKSKLIDRLARLMKFIASAIVAAVVIWCGDIAPGNNQVSITSSLISAIFGMLILATGLGLAMRPDESQ